MDTVSFPKLGGLEFPLPSVAFKVFGMPIYWYGIIIAAGFLLAVLLGMKYSKDYGFEQETIIDLVLWACIPAVICARLYYVVFSWDEFRDNPIEIFYIRKGGLAIFGGLIGALGVAYIFTRVKKINVLKLFDFTLPYFVLAQAIGRWGNFFNQEAFGTNTNLPWGMTSDRVRSYLSFLQETGSNVNPDLPVHPTFLYESLWDLAVFFVLIWFRKNKKKLEGEVFFLYLILYGAGRAWVEGLRTDSLMLGNLRISQVLSILLVIVFTVLIFYRRKKVEDAEFVNSATGKSVYGEILKEMDYKVEVEASETVAEKTADEVVEEAKDETDEHK